MSEQAIYVLSNPSLPGMVKIGRTQNDPVYRARNLSSSTSVPKAFNVEYQVRVADGALIEAVVHERLRDCRISNRREFFEVSVEEAIKTVDAVAGKSGVVPDAKELETEWNSAIRFLSTEDRFKAFDLRLGRCTPVIQKHFNEIRAHVENFQGVSTSIDSKVDGVTFFRSNVNGRPRRFFRMDPKHSAKTPNIGVAFFSISPDRIENVTGLSVRRQLKQDGNWIFMYADTRPDKIIQLAKECFKNVENK